MLDVFPDWFLRAYPDAVDWAKLLPSTSTPPVLTAPSGVPSSYSVVGGETLTIAAPGVLTGAYSPLALSMTAVLAEAPAFGTLTLFSDGSFTFIAPSEDEIVGIAFKFVVRDSAGNQSPPVTASIEVTPNVPPPSVEFVLLSVEGYYITSVDGDFITGVAP